jgi:curved DNA-binding protein CbpA
MRGFPRASEITYYEELGVTTDASAEEIRDAFRALVRLLHPDQQTDEQLKDIAEKQMRKLNRIYAVLSDPERRQHYDESLDGNYSPIIVRTGPPPEPSKIAGRVAWIGAILISAGFLIWLASSDNNALVQTRSHEFRVSDSAGRYQSGNPADDSPEITRLKSDLRNMTTQRDTAVRELTRLRGSPFFAQAGGMPPPDTQAQVRIPASATSISEIPAARPVSPPPPVAAPVAPVASRAESPVKRHFAGFWFYVKPPQGQHNKNQALYLPEFMEVSIKEENGGLTGTYRSRYQIVDRAISPDVNFSFSCSSPGPVALCPWTGPGGSKGELTMQLNSENALRFDWNANELGSQQGLVSGTAVLTRRIDPTN